MYKPNMKINLASRSRQSHTAMKNRQPQPILFFRPKDYTQRQVQKMDDQYVNGGVCKKFFGRLNRSYSSCFCYSNIEKDDQIYVSPSNVISKEFLQKQPKWRLCQRPIQK